MTTETVAQHPLVLIVAGLVKLLSEAPDLVRVEEEHGEPGFVRIAVHPGSDLNTRWIVGRRGQRINQVRDLVSEIAAGHGMRCRIRVVTDETVTA